jgi:hypothetical protein
MRYLPLGGFVFLLKAQGEGGQAPPLNLVLVLKALGQRSQPRILKEGGRQGGGGGLLKVFEWRRQHPLFRPLV